MFTINKRFILNRGKFGELREDYLVAINHKDKNSKINTSNYNKDQSRKEFRNGLRKTRKAFNKNSKILREDFEMTSRRIEIDFESNSRGVQKVFEKNY